MKSAVDVDQESKSCSSRTGPHLRATRSVLRYMSLAARAWLFCRGTLCGEEGRAGRGFFQSGGHHHPTLARPVFPVVCWPSCRALSLGHEQDQTKIKVFFNIAFIFICLRPA